MAKETLETITREEFDNRFDANNERLKQELAEAQERVLRLEELIARKERFAKRMDQMVTEVEREETEIATLEKSVRSPRAVIRRQPAGTQPPR